MDSAGRRFNSVYAYPNLLPIKDEVGLMFVRNAAGHDDWSTMCYGTENESKYNMALWNKDRLVGVAADETGEFYEFTIDEAMSGIWYVRIYMESQNPEPYTFNLQYTIDKIQIITSDNKHTFTLKAKDINEDNLYESNTLKLSIAPISYIASYS